MQEKETISAIEQLYMEVTGDHWEAQEDLMVLKKSDGIFTPALTTWLMLWQKLLPKHSMGAVLQELQQKINDGGGLGILEWVSESKKVRFNQISSSTGGLSHARQRLPLKVIEEVADEMYDRIGRNSVKSNKWREKKVYLVDGTTLAFVNTPVLKKAFPPARNNSGACFPIARVVVAHDLVDGIALRPEIGTKHDSEQKLAKAILPRLQKGSVVLGDRNFGVFSIAYYSNSNGLSVALRLTKDRVGRLIGHENVERDCEQDIVWKPSPDDRRTNQEIPKDSEIKGKVVVITSNRKGFRPKTFYFFTTIPDISPEELLEFYTGRWNIETDLRSIKHCIGLEVILAKDPDMVRKEIIVGVMAYNLVCATIARGAAAIGVQPRQISFTRAVMLITSTSLSLVRSKSNKERQAILSRFLTHLRQIKLPNRKTPRSEPRAIVRRKGSYFPALRVSRKEARLKLSKSL